MSHANRILTSGLVIEVWVGRITMEEVFDYVGRRWSDPNKSSERKIFVDITRASFDPSIGEKEIQQIIDLYQHRRDKTLVTRIAIVAGNDFDRASLFGQLAEQGKLNVIVFNSISTACIWLGVKILEVRECLERVHAELLGSSPTSKSIGDEEARL